MAKEQSLGTCVPAAPVQIFPAQGVCENISNNLAAQEYMFSSIIAEHAPSVSEALHEKFHGNLLKEGFYGLGNLAGDAEKSVVDFFTPEEHQNEEIHEFMADVNNPVNQVADATEKQNLETLHSQYTNENIVMKGVHGIGNLGADLRKGVSDIFSSDDTQVERFRAARTDKTTEQVAEAKTYALDDPKFVSSDEHRLA